MTKTKRNCYLMLFNADSKDFNGTEPFKDGDFTVRYNNSTYMENVYIYLPCGLERLGARGIHTPFEMWNELELRIEFPNHVIG